MNIFITAVHHFQSSTKSLLLAGELNKQLAGASDATGSSLQDLGTQFSAAQAAATEAAGSVAGQLSDSANNALQTLPAPLREALLAAARPVSKVCCIQSRQAIWEYPLPVFLSFPWDTLSHSFMQNSQDFTSDRVYCIYQKGLLAGREN